MTHNFHATPRVQPAAWQQGLSRDTARQCGDQTTGLVVQDTPALPRTGCHVLPKLGPMGSGNFAQDVLLHRTLALTEQGAMRGVLGRQTRALQSGNVPGPATEAGGTWLHGIAQAHQVVWKTAWAAGATAPPRLMHLMDREGDVDEVLQWVEEVGERAIIRCVQNAARGRTVAVGPWRDTSATGAGPRDAHRTAVARHARPDRDSGNARVAHHAASGSSEIPPRVGTDVDAGRGGGTAPHAGMRGATLIVVGAGARNDTACFIDVTVFGRQTATSVAYLVTGRPVLIEGRLYWRSWEPDGQKRSKHEVIAERVQFLGTRPQTPGAVSVLSVAIEDDDIPFETPCCGSALCAPTRRRRDES